MGSRFLNSVKSIKNLVDFIESRTRLLYSLTGSEYSVLTALLQYSVLFSTS